MALGCDMQHFRVLACLSFARFADASSSSADFGPPHASLPFPSSVGVDVGAFSHVLCLFCAFPCAFHTLSPCARAFPSAGLNRSSLPCSPRRPSRQRPGSCTLLCLVYF